MPLLTTPSSRTGARPGSGSARWRPGDAWALGLAMALATWCGGAGAERSDRTKPMVVEADREGSLDTQRQTLVFQGNAVVSQGSLVIRADRIEVRDPPDGARTAVAVGTPASQASFRQRRDAPDEHVEAQADRIEYDGRSDTLRFVGRATARRLRGGVPLDEVSGALIVWDNRVEQFTMRGGAPTPANPGGRVRMVFSPPAPASAAAPAAPASSAPLVLQPSRQLGEKP